MSTDENGVPTPLLRLVCEQALAVLRASAPETAPASVTSRPSS